MLVWSLVKVVCHGLCYLSLKTAVLSDSTLKVKSHFLCHFTHEGFINIYKILPTRILLTHEGRNYPEITQIYFENCQKWNFYHGLDKSNGWNAKIRHLQIHLFISQWFSIHLPRNRLLNESFWYHHNKKCGKRFSGTVENSLKHQQWREAVPKKNRLL